jgi:hypothetical protein
LFIADHWDADVCWAATWYIANGTPELALMYSQLPLVEYFKCACLASSSEDSNDRFAEIHFVVIV